MNIIIVIAALLSIALSSPVPQDFNLPAPQTFNDPVPEGSNAPQQVSQPSVVRYYFDLYPNNEGYKFSYELSDGQIRSEEGKYKDGEINGNPVKILVVQGAYSYIAPDGETYWVNYQSDENGYRPNTGKGVGGIKPGEDASIDPNLLKSLVG